MALENLYPKLSAGGVLVVDDYAIAQCRQAVTDYRKQHDITSPIHRIENDGPESGGATNDTDR